MAKRTFFGCLKPKLKYEVIGESYRQPIPISPAKNLILFFHPDENPGPVRLRIGDPVSAGERIYLTENIRSYVIFSRSGRISNISRIAGFLSEKYIAVTVDLDDLSHQVADESYKNAYQASTLKNAMEFLAAIPGRPRFEPFLDQENPVHTIAVLGVDRDLVSATNQYFVKNGIVSIKTGIDLLRQITGVHDVILIVAPHLAQVAGSSGAIIKTVDFEYPSGHPALIKQYFLSQKTGNAPMLSSGSSVAFFTAEAVSCIGAAYNTGRLPLEKTVFFISKDGKKRLISVPLGTPVQDILDAFNEPLNNRDRLIVGGPMAGVSVSSALYPVLPDTDTVMVQDASAIPEAADTACINCGECVRVCPVKIPVNMLARHLAARRYETARDHYDLYACIECGFCAYVCPARIPILQQVKVAKYSLEKE